MFGKFDEEYTKKSISKIPSLTYHGAFNNIDDISPSKYDMFLYTSKMDGLPNVVLEIPHYNVPMIASNAGGIGDFVVNNKTGLLIDDLYNEKEYVKAIKMLGEDQELRKKLASGAKRMVEKRHSWEAFLDTVKKDFLN